MNIGVDTLHLHCREWKVRASAQLEVQPAAFEVGTGKPTEERPDVELFNGVRGVKAWANRPLWNLTVRPFRGAVNAFISLSVPKVASGGRNNYAPATPEGTWAALGQVEAELFGAGFECGGLNFKLRGCPNLPFAAVQVQGINADIHSAPPRAAAPIRLIFLCLLLEVEPRTEVPRNGL